jgi:hypothetical protein
MGEKIGNECKFYQIVGFDFGCLIYVMTIEKTYQDIYNHFQGKIILFPPLSITYKM